MIHRALTPCFLFGSDGRIIIPLYTPFITIITMIIVNDERFINWLPVKIRPIKNERQFFKSISSLSCPTLIIKATAVFLFLRLSRHIFLRKPGAGFQSFRKQTCTNPTHYTLSVTDYINEKCRLNQLDLSLSHDCCRRSLFLS